MGKEHIGLKFSCDSLMVGEFFSIVECDCMCTRLERSQQIKDGFFYSISCSAGDLFQERETGLSPNQCDNCTSLSSTDNGVSFPITKPFSLFNDLWTFFNTHLIRDLAATILVSSTFPTFLLTAQVLVEITTRAFVHVNVLVDPFVAHSCICVLFQPV